MSIRTPVWVASTSASGCALIWLSWGIYLYWRDVRLINFLAAWIPFVVSILVAFVPEHKMTPAKKILWRSGVIFLGFAWSVVLWHQQVITGETAKQDQTAIVGEAVTQSNSHSDDQFVKVEKNLEDTKTDLISRIDKVPTQITKTESDLNATISKVGTLPTKYAQVQFGVFDPSASEPVTSEPLIPDSDGVYTLDFGATNISDTQTGPIDIWVYICQECTYAGEPAGFDRPQGIPENEIHKVIGPLNPGVSFEKMTIKFKVSVGPYKYTDVFFKYSCSSCGKIGPAQSIRGFLAKPLPRAKLN